MEDLNFFKKELDNFIIKQRYDLAQKTCREFLDKHPCGFLYNYLGYICFLQENYHESIASYNKALSFKEKENTVYQNLAECYLKLNDFSQAKSYFLKSLKINTPNIYNIKKVYTLSNYDLDYKDFYDLLNCSNISKFINQNNINFIYELINFLINENETGLLNQYANHDFVNSLISKDQYFFLKGYIFFYLNLFDIAEKFFLKISDNTEIKISSYNFLFDIYCMKGKTYLAYKFFLKLFRNNSISAQIIRTMTMFYKFKSTKDNLFIKMNEFFLKQKEKLNALDKVNLYFCYAKAYDDIKNHHDSFDYLKMANQEMNRIIKCDLEKINYEINVYKKVFNSEFYKKFKNCGYKEIKPIFITGLPRSGSTILEQIISQSGLADSLSEIKFFNANLKYFFNIHDPVIFHNQIKNLNEKQIYEIGKKYHSSLNYLTNNKIFIDKMLHNFHYLILIKLSLPNSKIILTKRNYKDNFLSIYKNYFSDNQLAFAYDENNIINFIKIYDDIVRYYCDILNEDVFLFDYDKFVKNPNEIMRKTFKFCDLKWEDCFLKTKNDNYIPTASRAQARKGIYNTSLRGYKLYENYFKKSFEKLEKL